MMRLLENRIPPPIVLLVCLLLIRLVANFDQLLSLPLLLRIFGAGTLVLIGVSLAVIGVRAFKRSETTINPLDPAAASNLVTDGIYQYTRNPMYLGMVLVSIAASIYFSSILSLVVVAGFCWFINRFQIVPEERAMASLFKEAFQQYQQRVRRWI